MAAPYNSLRSKNDRAICAYLISAGCGSVDDILPFTTTKDLEFPLTLVRSANSKVEGQQSSTGNRRIRVFVHICGKASPDDGGQSRVEFDKRVAQTKDALMQSNDNLTLNYTAAQITALGNALAVDETGGADADAAKFAANNADMVDYTCQYWYEAGEGEPQAHAEGADWEEILMFDSVCCASSVDMS